MPKKLHILIIIASFSLICSCSYTRHVPEGKTILWDNDIEVKGDVKAPSGAGNILKQRETKHFLWELAPELAIYNWGNGTDSSFFSKIGTPPVIFDSAKAQTGAEQLQDFFFNHGYFNATSSYKVITNEEKKRTYVEYYIDPGSRYYIKNYTADISNKNMHDLYSYFSYDELIKEKEPYDADVLDDERERLAQVFRDHGYYNFSKNFITFEADTFLTGDSVNVKLAIGKQPVENKDTVLYKDYEQYRINNVYIRPDYSYLNPNEPEDSTVFRSYKIIYDSLDYKPRYLTDAVHFRQGELYNQNKVKDTYSHLVNYNAFKFTEINFKNAGTDTGGPVLDAVIHLAPMDKRTFTIEGESTTTSGNFGISASIGWVNRNVFKAGEELQVKINSGIEFQAAFSGDSRRSRTFELGTEIGVSFPRFLLPINTVGLLPKRMRPTSRVSVYANRLSRFEFDRETFGTRLSYNWKETELKTHQIDLIDISYSRLFKIDPGFLNRLNEIQRIAFKPALISASRYIWTYNEQVDPDRINHNFFRGSFEIAGNTLSLIESNVRTGEEDTTGVRTIAGVPYYQYFRIDIDYRFYWNFSQTSAWVNRIYAATIRPYGNSIEEAPNGATRRNPPFSKYLYLGGSNDLRAWPAYRIGAGTQPNTNYFPLDANGNYDKDAAHDTSFALGTIKLLYSSELRFPLFSFFKGAVFVDAGNIWLNGGLQSEQTNFRFRDFLNEIAIGAGIGLRLDFNFFLLRFDVAAKVRDPGQISQGASPWVIDNAPFRNLTYNIALGYPF